MIPADGVGVVVAVLAPVKAVLDDLTIQVVTDYPFGDSLQIDVLVTGPSAVPVYVRIPGWADAATVATAGSSPEPAANGTLYKVVCNKGATTISLELHPTIKIERGWGVPPTQGPSLVPYSAAGARLSTNSSEDFALSDGAKLISSKLPGLLDIRSGGPHEVSSATLNHVLYGEGHAIESISFSFRYLCGYKCTLASSTGAPTVSIDVIDAANHSVISTVYTSGPLNNYSYDRGDAYSPPVVARISGISVANSQPLQLSIRFNNKAHNLQLNIPADGLGFRVQWSNTQAPGPAQQPPSSNIIPGTNAAAVYRGPLLYTLRVGEQESLIRTWSPFNNTDVNLDNSTQWNYALMLDDAHPMTFVPAGMNRALPFNTSNYFAVIKASAKQLPLWREETNAAAEPPASPVDCSKITGGCGAETQVTLVPYGSTNLRMSGLPWIV